MNRPNRRDRKETKIYDDHRLHCYVDRGLGDLFHRWPGLHD